MAQARNGYTDNNGIILQITTMREKSGIGLRSAFKHTFLPPPQNCSTSDGAGIEHLQRTPRDCTRSDIEPVTPLKEDEDCGLRSEIEGQESGLMDRSIRSTLSI